MIHKNGEEMGERKGYLLLWAGVLLAPIVWLVQFQIRYSLVEWVCAHHSRLVLYLVSAVFFLLIAGSGVLSWQNWVREGGGTPSDEGSVPRERNRFLALLGLATSSLFMLVLLAQTIAAIMVDPCRH